MRRGISLNRQAISIVSAVALLLATLTPGLAAVVSADQATDQSIDMSSSIVGADAVSYHVKFTVSSAGAGAYVIDFCDNSAIVNTECTAPAGFDTTAVGTSTAGATVTAVTGSAGSGAKSAVKVVQTVDPSDEADVVLTGIQNPSYVTDGDTGFYARIATYANSTDADGYTDEDIGEAVDTGGVALAITNGIGVNAAVRETLTFCVAKLTITANCGDASADETHLPNLTLGSDGALDSSRIDTGDIYTQLSTNALSGAVVNLKSSATGCGGLMLAGSSACNIPPADGSNVAVNSAGFGIKLNAPFATASGAPNATGTLQAVSGSGYSTGSYFMGYVDANEGVTSPYGDPIIDSNGQPANNQNMKLTFGASINANTPAGNYSANLNLIATGKY